MACGNNGKAKIKIKRIKEKLVDWYRMRDTDHQAIP